MTKAEIIETIAHDLELSRKEARQIVDTFFSIMEDWLVRGERIEIRNFGIFTPYKKNSRPGRNPKTKAPAEIEPRRVIRFRPGRWMREMLEIKSNRSEDKRWKS